MASIAVTRRIGDCWKDGAAIDAMYVCNTYRFPMIGWTDGPPGTMGYAFTFYDTANMLVHIAMVNIPATVHALAPVPTGAVVSSIRPLTATIWAGPCPPAGMPHVYQLAIYALLIPANDGLWAVKSYAAFCEERERLMASMLRSLLFDLGVS